MSSRPTSPRVPELRNKWTVSPEFSDALLTAMRERSRTGGPGPLPRLPSLLQLSPVETLETPSPKSSPMKPDSAERLKMKTRVAIRDTNPHRFQVVSLGDAVRYTASDQSPKDCKTSTGTPPRSPKMARSNQSWKKVRADENTVPTSAREYLKTDTPDRIKTLSERNKNVPAPECPPSDLPPQSHLDNQAICTLPTRDTMLPPDSHGRSAENNKQAKESNYRSTLRAPNNSSRRTLHFKSPSLGNIRTKPNLVLDPQTTPLPRVACRKRTNTLSADHYRRSEKAPNTNSEAVVQCGHQNPGKDSLKRHAIYTQSMYVPVNERQGLLHKEGSRPALDEPSPLHAFPFRSSIPSGLNKPASTPLGSAPVNSALGFIDLPVRPPGLLESTFGSQSSISSVYSQDELAAMNQTRPLTRYGISSEFVQAARSSKLDEAPLQHHPIVFMLLVEIERAMQEWCTI
ncbi:hypothetical protein D9615_008042 [Tricholomella constricta]|uniref:Uncharacterized protein n=1 Tax=Tricholomella constricta TaxID=117010 RepID=A0A8H5LWC5_9AGAR|nr:hypothetical protein D9615_008042 [Tricholomella constricta]